MSTYTSAAEDAASMRKALKAKGITSRQVSVRSETFSMGSAVDVRIKAPGISAAMVREIVEPFEKIRRCEHSGEILSGGNRYISVSFDHALIESKAAEFLPWLKAMEITGNTLLPVPGMEDFYAGRQDEFRYSLSHDGRMVPSVYAAVDVAGVLARHAVEKG